MLGSQLVVVSDAHVRGDSEIEPLLAFFEAVPTLGDCLLINGDLFEFWFSYRRAIPRAGFLVAAALAMLRRRLPIVMTGGNHDRWGDSFWTRDAGIPFAAGEARLEVAGRTIVATHGDGIGEATRSAALTHRLISHPITAGAFGWLHPDLGLWLIDRFGGHLADRTTDPAVLERADARQIAWATQRLAADGSIDLLVLSHTHRPKVTEVGPGRFVLNPGAWIEGRRYAVVTATSIAIEAFAPG